MTCEQSSNDQALDASTSAQPQNLFLKYLAAIALFTLYLEDNDSVEAEDERSVRKLLLVLNNSLTAYRENNTNALPEFASIACCTGFVNALLNLNMSFFLDGIQGLAEEIKGEVELQQQRAIIADLEAAPPVIGFSSTFVFSSPLQNMPLPVPALSDEEQDELEEFLGPVP